MMVTQGPALLVVQDLKGEQVSFRLLHTYLPGSDMMVARIDVLTYKDGYPNKQFNCGMEIKSGIHMLPKPPNMEGFSTMISKETLIEMFESFVARLKDAE